MKEGKQCDLGHGTLKRAKAIEVGNIFPLGTYYSEKMGAMFTDQDGKKKPIWLASYGIGLTRAVGAIVEVHNDAKGIIWPDQVAPFKVHLIEISDKGQETSRAEEIYNELKKDGVEVLYDDREDVAPGAKFADADLIGIPVRLVVSERTGNKVEYKERIGQATELLNFDAVLKKITN